MKFASMGRNYHTARTRPERMTGAAIQPSRILAA